MSRAYASEVVVITGASGGVGRAAAIAFARRGARIGLLARGRGGLAGVRRDVEAVDREFGPIDVWVNGAMATVFAPVHQMRGAAFCRKTSESDGAKLTSTKRQRVTQRGFTCWRFVLPPIFAPRPAFPTKPCRSPRV